MASQGGGWGRTPKCVRSEIIGYSIWYDRVNTMCTLSVRFESDWGYSLAMNRDEAKSDGLVPRVVSHFRTDALRVVYPQDVESRGTWVGANGHGLTLALLNHPPLDSSFSNPKVRTRDGIIVEAIGERTVKAAMDRILRTDPTAHRPFVFVAVGPDSDPEIVVSDGRSIERKGLPRNSFSIDSDSISPRPGLSDLSTLDSACATIVRFTKSERSLLYRREVFPLTV